MAERVEASVLETTEATAHHAEDRAMERWISYVLRAGVLISGSIIAFGVALFLLKGPGPGEPRSRDELTANGGHAIATSLGQILHDVAQGKALGVIQLGLLALILTPVLRVAMTMVLFLRQRDWIFTAITLTVLTVLALGLIGVGA